LSEPANRTFVDTNVLVYAYDTSEKVRRPIAVDELSRLWDSRSGILSTQVLQEFYATATRKLQPTMARTDAREVVMLYDHWKPVQVDLPLIVAASRLEETHTLSFWDALIVETAQRAGATRLLSEDLQDGRRIGSVVIENPFAVAH
jgi:predicted nucleic acid-binding protein